MTDAPQAASKPAGAGAASSGDASPPEDASAGPQRPADAVPGQPPPAYTPGSGSPPPPPAAHPQTPPTWMPPAFCRACGAQLDPRAAVCPHCGVAQAPQAPVFVPTAPGTPERKSEGAAVLLSLLWPGAGHLYVGDNNTGVPLTVISGVLFLLSWTIILLVVTIPLWIVALIYALIDSSRKAGEHNRRFGFN